MSEPAAAQAAAAPKSSESARHYAHMIWQYRNAETVAAMLEARRGNLASFASVEALMADLNADD
jgi:hypothetical protein